MAKDDTTPTVTVAAEATDPTPVVEEQSFDTIALRSALIRPGGVLRLRRPTLAEEPLVQSLKRRTMRAQGINPDDFDPVIDNTFFFAALMTLCAEEPEKIDYFTALQPRNRKEQDALRVFAEVVWAWYNDFLDPDTPTGT